MCGARVCEKARMCGCVLVCVCVCARVRAFPRPRANDVLCARVVREPVNVLRACVFCCCVRCVCAHVRACVRVRVRGRKAQWN